MSTLGVLKKGPCDNAQEGNAEEVEKFEKVVNCDR